MKTTEQLPPDHAVIYCRVSSTAQLQKGHGIASQETRCREFARMKGYDVAEVFRDEAVSGGLISRPGIQAMLDFLKVRRKTGTYVVIIDDISRLARDMRAHLELRRAIADAGARLESPSVEFGEDSDSILVENLLASVSQHQRQKNAEQTFNRMVARVLNGFWPFHSCIGYRHVSKPGSGRVLIRDEPLASILQEGLEGYASGRFQTQAEVKRFFESQPAFPKNVKGEVRNQLVNDILTKALYAGYVSAPQWGVGLRKGQHEALISFATFERIQERLKDGAKMPARADIGESFPLRGAISCGCCSRPLTACWSTSKTGKKHAYYYCFSKGCARKGKAIRRDVLEGAFVELLDKLTPSPNLFDMAKAMFKNAWDQRLVQTREMVKSYGREITKTENQIATLLDRIVETTSASVIVAYEKRIEELERYKLLIEEKREKAGKPRASFEEMFELAFDFLASPSKIWRSGKLELQKLVLRLTFADRLLWSANEGFQTPQYTMPFKMLGDANMSTGKMADKVGFEPTVRFHVHTRSRRAP